MIATTILAAVLVVAFAAAGAAKVAGPQPEPLSQ